MCTVGKDSPSGWPCLCVVIILCTMCTNALCSFVGYLSMKSTVHTQAPLLLLVRLHPCSDLGVKVWASGVFEVLKTKIIIIFCQNGPPARLLSVLQCVEAASWIWSCKHSCVNWNWATWSNIPRVIQCSSSSFTQELVLPPQALKGRFISFTVKQRAGHEF